MDNENKEVHQPTQKEIKYPRMYHATESDLRNRDFYSATPRIGAYRNILTWRK
jgi:hypothetical protein